MTFLTLSKTCGKLCHSRGYIDYVRDTMGKKRSPTFVTEIPLVVTPSQEKILLKRFEAARKVYNACVGEGLKRLRLMRQSKAYQAASKLPKGDSKSDDPIKQKQATDRQEAFAAIRQDFDMIGDYSLHKYAQQFGRCWITHHLGSQVVKAIATKAYRSVNEYALGIRGRPKFRRYGEYKSVKSGNFGKELLFECLDGEWIVSWRIGRVEGKLGKILNLKTIVDTNDPVIRHGLQSRLKHVQIIYKELAGKKRFFAQLINEGTPYEHITPGHGVGGVDIGPSTIAGVIFSENEQDHAFLKLFCQELADIEQEVAKIQRQISRQQRLNNPDKFGDDWWQKKPGGKNWVHKRGKVKKGSKGWVKSTRQKENEIKLRELRRKQAAHRQSLHGYLVNRIVETIDEVRLEKLSYKAFQRMFGRSVGMRAPGGFVALLKQRIKQYGGTVHEFSTRNTRLSQLDHKTGELKKKPLSQRWHTFDDGETVQRDLYSAFLAACVEDGVFNATMANELWPGAGSLLRAALNDIETGELEGIKIPSSFGLKRIKARKSRDRAGRPRIIDS